MANSIQDALAAVQRKINEQRMKNSVTNHNAIQEAIPNGVVRKTSPDGSQQSSSWSGSLAPGESKTVSSTASSSSVGGGRGNVVEKPGERAAAAAAAPRQVPRPLPRPAAAAAPAVDPNAKSKAMFSAASGDNDTPAAFFAADKQRQSENAAAAVTPKPAAAGAPKPAAAAPKPAGNNSDVMKQQQALIAQGHKIKADGIMGPKTKAAMDAQGKVDAMKMGRGAGDRSAATASASPSEPDASKLPGGDTGMNDREVRSANMQNVSNNMAKQEKSDTATSAVKDYVAQNKDALNASAAEQDPSLKQDFTKDEQSESGPKKGKKKMSESTLINAFLKLQETKAVNVFEAAKKMRKEGGPDSSETKDKEYSTPVYGENPDGSSAGPGKKRGNPARVTSQKELDDLFKEEKAKKDWDKDGKVESDKDEVWGSRFRAAKKAGKMEEELKGDQDKIDANKNGKIDSDDFRKLRSGKKAEKMKAYRADRDKHGEMEEEVEFSEAELAHFEAVIARKDQKGKEKGMGDTVPSEDLTDEYINEMAQRGVKAGQKRGSYKKKATDLQGNRVASADAEPDEATKGVPHVLDQIRHGREDEHGFKTITHPASSPEAPVSKAIHRSELHGFYDTYHNTEKPAAKEKAYSGFLGKHFGDERTSAPTSQSVTTDLSKVEKANLKGGGAKPTLGGSKLVGGKK